MVQVALSNSIKKLWNVWIDYTAVEAFFNLLRKTHLHLATRVQCDIAPQLRTQLTEVLIRRHEAKRGSCSKSEARDKATISIIQLRADVQNAIENENYAVAAGLRDQVSKLEAESFAASARTLAYENAQYAFCLGQKARHKFFVALNMQKRICRDAFMPWEHILRTECYNSGLVVPEENLVAPEKPDLESFDHPYTSFLFYGMETPGDFILIKQLREKHNKPRQS
ncbi:hypothetical protein NC653_020775 [Populus alba x Populus x berolinensis]|uniref:UVR domain-containing protein n=1 Tax=Populus alba x Populus x berolinensis TaxID=444605 RepID=A0AAD6MLK1_9ROSI|nr:hypothetical protein NC653_020775 [Populus alba x Populus x berolinensis]